MNKYCKISVLAALIILSAGVFIYSFSLSKPKDIKMGLAVLVGDCNSDSRVDILDFQLLSNTFGKASGQSGFDSRCDFNNSNSVDILDFQILSNNFGRTEAINTPTATPPVASTPFPTSFSSGKEYYVSTSGNDTNSGDINRPFRTIQKGVSAALAGDLIVVRSGTYNENITINKSGTSTNPITITKYSGESVLINAGSGHGIKDSGGQKYWIIDGLNINTTGSSAVAILATSTNWGGSITGNWIIRNNTLTGGGILIRGNYHLVENNIIDGQHTPKSSDDYQSGIRDTYGGATGTSDLASVTHHNIYRNNTIKGFYRSAIWSMKYTHDNIFEGNTISDIYGTGSGPGQCINTDAYGAVAWRHTIRNNKISGCGAEGIQLENTFDSIVENNLVTGSTRAITLINYTSGSCTTVNDGQIYGDRNRDGSCRDENNNTIIRQNVIVGSGTAFVNYGMDGVHYLNNSLYNSGGFLFTNIQFAKTNVIGNIFNSTLPSTLSNHHNLITNDPGYVAPAGFNLGLKPTATLAIDKGTSVDTFTNSVSQPFIKDFIGNPRLKGSAYDIGAYEF